MTDTVQVDMESGTGRGIELWRVGLREEVGFELG
jgi:hypothetical protein